MPRKTDSVEADKMMAETASMRPRPMPRKTAERQPNPIRSRSCFNEAAAHAAENPPSRNPPDHALTMLQ